MKNGGKKNLDNYWQTFASWLGNENASSRVKAREHIKQKNYKKILDIPCGLCTEYYGFKKDDCQIEYFGMDVTPKLVQRALKLGINVKEANIESIPSENSSFDCSYARHILEHLPYYQKAISELIRVSKNEVIIIFFIKSTKKNDHIDLSKVDNSLLYHNHYNIEKIEKFILSNSKVLSTEWENLEKESILHIYLKT